MTANKRSKGTNAVCIPRSEWQDIGLFDTVSKLGEKHRIGFVLVENNEDFCAFWSRQENKPWGGKNPITRLVVLWSGRPVDAAAMLSWRSGLIEEGDFAYRLEILPIAPGQQEWEEWFQSRLGEWLSEPQPREEIALKIGCEVIFKPEAGNDDMGAYDSAFLTISPSGGMSQVLEALDECKRLFRTAIGSKLRERRENVHKTLINLLAFDPKDSAHGKDPWDAVQKINTSVRQALEKNSFYVDRNQLPRVLLLGPSGVGKTLIAHYLAWRTSARMNQPKWRPFKRVPVPEYLEKESNFEYDVFGYTSGAFTDARTMGSRGFLMERLGGVIFFDEIGDASPAIQSKLLAYLDNYRVSPRGWEGDPIACPMLVVAATNRPIEKWADEDDGTDMSVNRFRNDLFRRFNMIVYVPPLNDRKEDLPYILDAMMQMDAFNSGKKVKEIGKDALSAIVAIDYEKGNFRTLENLFRSACRAARMEGRDYIVKADVENAKR